MADWEDTPSSSLGAAATLPASDASAGTASTADTEETSGSEPSPSDELLRDIARIDEAPRPAEIVGTRLAHFEVLAVLGGGGMGVVYLAADLRLGRRVALKLIRGDDPSLAA